VFIAPFFPFFTYYMFPNFPHSQQETAGLLKSLLNPIAPKTHQVFDAMGYCQTKVIDGSETRSCLYDNMYQLTEDKAIDDVINVIVDMRTDKYNPNLKASTTRCRKGVLCFFKIWGIQNKNY
jgi:hypothetical protein